MYDIKDFDTFVKDWLCHQIYTEYRNDDDFAPLLIKAMRMDEKYNEANKYGTNTPKLFLSSLSGLDIWNGLFVRDREYEYNGRKCRGYGWEDECLENYMLDDAQDMIRDMVRGIINGCEYSFNDRMRDILIDQIIEFSDNILSYFRELAQKGVSAMWADELHYTNDCLEFYGEQDVDMERYYEKCGPYMSNSMLECARKDSEHRYEFIPRLCYLGIAREVCYTLFNVDIFPEDVEAIPAEV